MEDLHKEMLEPELAYYFDTVEKQSVPDYELVYLPQIEALVEDDSKENDAFQYDFAAFGRSVRCFYKYY